MPKLSQYELDREANIARNLAIMQGLALHHSSSLLGKTKNEKPKPNAKPVQPAKRKRKDLEEEAPRRQSARLRKTTVVPNETPAERKKREAEEVALRIKQEEERLAAEGQARAAKKPRHEDLVLHKLVPQDPEDISTLNNIFKAVTTLPHPRRAGEFDAFVYNDKDKRESREVAELTKKLESLKVVARAKVNQNRIYSAAYHPEISKDLVFFGDKHGELGIWDARAAPEEVVDEDDDVEVGNHESGRYWQLQLHWPATSKSSISSIRFDPVNAHNVYTTSYDCTIRKLSFTTEVSTEVYASEDGVLITHMDLTPSGHEMWISDGLGGATHVDLREGRSKVRRYGLSDHKIGSISVNPTRPNFILTASNSRALKIWDVRKLQTLSGELADPTPLTPPASSPVRGGSRQPPVQTVAEFDSEIITEFVSSKKGSGTLRGEFTHDKSCSSAYWDPRGRQIVSTSYDDTLRLWDLNRTTLDNPEPFKTFKPFSLIRHNCQTGRWLSILRAQWSPNPDAYPHFTIGNMGHSLDVFSGRGDLLARLSDPSRISAVQAVTCSHPNIVERAASGNASGRCVLWAPADVGYSSQSP